MTYRSQTLDIISFSNGKDSVLCYIESSEGTMFSETLVNEGKETTLTARIYIGSEEVDPKGKLYYTWYYNNEEIPDEHERTIEIKVKNYLTKDIYFTATEKLEEKEEEEQ